ncbi:MAG: BCCT family transporter, partial [Thermodesulfobacteriota bacterium]
MEEKSKMQQIDPEAQAGESWFHLDVHPQVFFISAGLILFFVIITLVFQEHMEVVFQQMQSGISDYAGWFFIWTVNIVLVFILSLLAGRFGDIRLGGPDARPEFSTLGWFAMLFSAGMGIGLLFYGVAEPMFHYVANPHVEAGTTESARMAMDITFLHWGLHPWGVYSLVGLSLAFFSFNKGLPLSIRTAFYPLFGERIYGWTGHVIDILATVATLFGVATSLGLGVQQVNAGLDHLLGIGQSPT